MYEESSENVSVTIHLKIFNMPQHFASWFGYYVSKAVTTCLKTVFNIYIMEKGCGLPMQVNQYTKEGK